MFKTILLLTTDLVHKYNKNKVINIVALIIKYKERRNIRNLSLKDILLINEQT